MQGKPGSIVIQTILSEFLDHQEDTLSVTKYSNLLSGGI